MNIKLLFILSAIFLIIMEGIRYREVNNQPALELVNRQAVYKNKFIRQCSPDWNQLDADSLADGIGVLPGWGSYRWHIHTDNDSAQFYFNQGISMYYAFHIIEAMASFKKAQRFDENNAMIYWAQALAYGPNINDYSYAATPGAFAAAQKALSLYGSCTAKEKALITAMAIRYTAGSSISRSILNQQYADAMQHVYSQFPQDADVATMYADALMLQHPWDYWKHNGNAQPWTPQLVEVLEKTLAIHPTHPGANHYYIHSVEASPHPEKAMASADKLGSLMPQVSHMVHMPSHIYIRTGNYTKGLQVNELSINGYNKYLSLYPGVKDNAFLYVFHTLHMLAACALMKSNFTFSSQSAAACAASFDTSYLSMPPPTGNFIQYLYASPLFNLVRFGKWDEVLAAAAMEERHVFANTLWHWARGMAFARKNNINAAREELQLMQQKMLHPDMQVVAEPFNAPVAAANVAEKILAGVIAEGENKLSDAVGLLAAAAASEDALIYNEPRDWLLPARQYLGAVLLKTGNAAKAEKSFREELKENPNNHWSLYGLYLALNQQKKQTAARLVKQQYLKALKGAEMAGGVIVY